MLTSRYYIRCWARPKRYQKLCLLFQPAPLVKDEASLTLRVGEIEEVIKEEKDYRASLGSAFVLSADDQAALQVGGKVW
jgi:hypothetical protein